MSEEGSEFRLPEDEQETLIRVFGALNRGLGWHTEAADILPRWERTVEKCRRGYHLGFDDYTNDLTVREMIQDVLDAASPDELASFTSRVAELDRLFRDATIDLGQPIFYASRASLLPDRFFFYYRVPRDPGEEMAQDLIYMKFIAAAEELR